MRELYGVFVDGKQIVEARTIKDNLESFYNLLDCNIIDIVSRKIGDVIYSIVCDDEGLFKNNNVISALSVKGEVGLVGKLFICKDGSSGELESLTDEDVENIKRFVVTYKLIDGTKHKAIILQ